MEFLILMLILGWVAYLALKVTNENHDRCVRKWGGHYWDWKEDIQGHVCKKCGKVSVR